MVYSLQSYLTHSLFLPRHEIYSSLNYDNDTSITFCQLASLPISDITAMADTVLTSLCQICHLTAPKYTCPRCAQQTCSLACSQRHKKWSQCNGVRDPTVYKPIYQVATPAGIDHDYNFLHGIEVGRERSERELVEARGIVDLDELRDDGDDGRARRLRGPVNTGVMDPVQRRARELRMEIVRAPKGMRRARENGTNWSRKKKCVHWQVEWLHGGERVLGKVMETRPVGLAWDEQWEHERKKSHRGDATGLLEKKRKRNESETDRVPAGAADKKKLCADELVPDDADASTKPAVLQNLLTGAWNAEHEHDNEDDDDHGAASGESQRAKASYQLYLHRPMTPSSMPKVLVPLNHSQSLSQILRYRVVLEFPTIHVVEHRGIGGALPEGFMLEADYAAATGQAIPQDSDAEMGVEDEGDSTSSSALSSLSSSSDDVDEPMSLDEPISLD